MKATILSGLIAVALGGLISCSNILEENSVINNVAESGMGELRINLTTDPTVEAITKSNTPEDLSNFTVSIGETTYNYTQWYNQTLLVKTGSDQTITAYNLSTVDDFAWNKPYYKGENSDVDIVAGTPATVTINCTRANSTLAIDTTGFEPSKGETKILCVHSLMAFNGENNEQGFNLLKKDNEPAKSTDSVCVKAGIVAKIVLTPAKMDGTTLSPVTRYLTNDENSTTSGNTTAAQKYKIAYKVNTENGQATITITVNGKVDDVPINVDVNPYESNTNSRS